MSGDTEIEDLEISDGASENEYSEHEHEPDVVKEEDDHTDMAEQRFRPGDVDENGKTIVKPKPEPKDPLRPRRKKARRACFACQRAHLTCGGFTFSSFQIRSSPEKRANHSQGTNDHVSVVSKEVLRMLVKTVLGRRPNTFMMLHQKLFVLSWGQITTKSTMDGLPAVQASMQDHHHPQILRKLRHPSKTSSQEMILPHHMPSSPIHQTQCLLHFKQDYHTPASNRRYHQHSRIKWVATIHCKL